MPHATRAEREAAHECASRAAILDSARTRARDTLERYAAPPIPAAKISALTWADLQPTTAGGFRIEIAGQVYEIAPTAAIGVHEYWRQQRRPADDQRVFPPAA